MVVIKKKKMKNQSYYYLEHSIREGKNVKKKEIYLGKKIPKNIEQLKKKFLDDIYKERWYADVDRIKQRFSKEYHTMPKSAREKQLQNFAISFTYDTQRIEGSTLTLRETADLLEKGITPKNRPIRDVKEAEAHIDLFNEILNLKNDLSLQMVLEWHWKLFSLTKADIAGKIRKHQVTISGSRFMPPSPVEVYPLLTEFFKWYKKSKHILHPIELAAISHLKFVTIHPFADGNGRISRLIMNFILYKNDYPMLDIKYEGRNSYYNALEKSHLKKDIRYFYNGLSKNTSKNIEDIFSNTYF